MFWPFGALSQALSCLIYKVDRYTLAHPKAEEFQCFYMALSGDFSRCSGQALLVDLI